MLCNVCIDALRHRKGWVRMDVVAGKPSITLAHHESVASLESSARDACELCRPFWCQISEDNRSRLRKFHAQWASSHTIPKSRVPGQRIEKLDGFVTFCIIINHNDESDSKPLGMGLTLNLKFESTFNDASPLRQKRIFSQYALRTGAGKDVIKMKPFLSNNTGSEEALAKAPAWIQTCTSTHQACNVEMKAEPWFPTRLLDPSAVDGSPDTFRLIITSEMPPACDERYATLSHCWGSAQFLQLKRSTISELRKGVQVSALPKTFREAIQVTRMLGLHLLWIDSLCIFQDRDDLSDWLVEAALMHKVYAHSFCNISAAGASDSSKGLFFERDQRISLNTEVRVCTQDLGLGVDYVECRIENFGFWTDEVNNCPLNKRGWVLQERFISPRVLHFGRNQLFWECRENTAAECYPESLPQVFQATNGVRLKRLGRPVYGSNDLNAGLDAHDSMFYHPPPPNHVVNQNRS
ncbi:hypothetical protein MRS44_018329 [Fusarium solani]|uniref:uncharacterized protein n=1 Tax=Fusarium solani TaxID=169388 RepID=UPI0032C46C69|nr:hypothetical protein MRS44_018329 [Fusarium solani]